MQRRPDPAWTLRLHATAQLVTDGGGVLQLERKTAAFLALLATDGPMTRSKVAGLLWADSSEQRARANLRQLLSRLRKQAGGELVGQGEPLRLLPAVHVELSPELLGCYEFDDCLELSEWLAAARERLVRLQLTSLDADGEQLERMGDLAGALRRAEQAAALDPLSERCVRRLMRLHLALDDRAAALRVFRDCEQRLERELGVAPAEETRRLAHAIGVGDAPVPEAPRRFPAATLHPPGLVGRERDWARLEAAWSAGRTIFLGGAAGVGKSRLALDFARSKGVALVIESRPGDADVPFASQARAVRQVFTRWPDLALPDWARRELSRMLPALASPDRRPPPLQGSDDRLHFLEAQAELLRRAAACEGRHGEGVALVVDDLQFCDPWSAEVGHYLFSNRDLGFRPILTYRTGQLPPPLQRSMEQLVDAGIAESIELPPLDTTSVEALVGALGLERIEGIGLAGGLPALVLEMAKSALDRRAAGRDVPPANLERLIRARLGKLTGTAVQLAQVAALATDQLSAELAAAVLGVRPIDLAEAWAELEAAQFLQGNRIVHDLVCDVIRAGLPQAIAEHLHRCIARELERLGADPTAIAAQWQAGGAPERAAPHLIA
ncbi:BTAD domain-containing putative transcriptional regulator [Vulgatibacter sp.]|uniref:BTAD domain-containing putative transcriptional regulator n=1 Tax=Vulgatibacter sp. TaxID=1971226 RepID=UPI00356B16FA